MRSEPNQNLWTPTVVNDPARSFPLAIKPGRVDAWWIELDRGEPSAEFWNALLNPTERNRASRFRRGVLRRRFIAGRAALRSILGAYLGCDPAELDFDYGPQGKPTLSKPFSGQGLQFNLAHSKAIAVCALTAKHPIGVDVETDRPTDMADRITSRFFSAAEQTEFFQISESDREAAFLRGWTRKEAFIKATGMGLAYPLDDFDVTLAVNEPKILRVGQDPKAAKRYAMADLPIGDAAAVVVEGPLEKVRFFHFQETGTRKAP